MIEKSRLLRKNDGRKRTNGNNKDIFICNENGDAKKEHRRTTTHATRPLRDNMCVYHQDETPPWALPEKERCRWYTQPRTRRRVIFTPHRNIAGPIFARRVACTGSNFSLPISFGDVASPLLLFPRCAQAKSSFSASFRISLIHFL